MSDITSTNAESLPRPTAGPACQFVVITYRNHRGAVGVRRVQPHALRFGSCAWHPAEQWLLDGWDLDRQVDRTFAMKDILSWRPA